jgi:hypothetical protein
MARPGWIACGVITVLVVALISLEMALLSAHPSAQPPSPATPETPGEQKEVQEAEEEPLVPSAEVRAEELEGGTYVWVRKRASVGGLLLFHGCRHTGQDWLTLPEDRAAVLAALDMGFAVAALTNTNKFSGCWNADTDLAHTKQVLKTLEERWPEHFGRHPLFGLGASSGGTFVSMMAPVLGLDGIVVIVSPGSPNVSSKKVPPTAFIYMSRDLHWASALAIRQSMTVLMNANIKTRSWNCPPKAITETFLSDRIKGFPRTQSEQFHDALIQSLDEDGYLLVSPRTTKLTQKVLKTLTDMHQDFTWTAYEKAIEEELNVAEAVHEMTRDHVPQALEWLLKEYKH